MPNIELSRANKKLNPNKLMRTRSERPKGWVPPNAIVQIPPDLLGNDIQLHWIRKYFSRAEEDLGSFFKRLSRGWTPVKPEEAPSLKHLSDPDGNIASNGCILCKIDKKVITLDVEYFEDLALGKAQHASVEYESDDRRSAVPKFSANKVKSFTGRIPS